MEFEKNRKLSILTVMNNPASNIIHINEDGVGTYTQIS